MRLPRILTVLSICWFGTQASFARDLEFNRDVRPILSETCFRCHGPDESARSAGLRLDEVAAATADRGGYSAIVPCKLEASEAWQRIISSDADLVMPPPDSHLALDEMQKETLRQWIEQGAKYEGHWAFTSPQRRDPPQVNAEFIRNPIDAFVVEQLHEHGLQANAPADPATLFRRLSFDLVGLPPSPDQVRSFVADFAERGEDAYQDSITALLNSPHFGERMAVPWMDQSRYADTNGYSIDGGRTMWLWRDWVINAYNANKPFDEFLVEQLAGDLLPDATEAQRLATGFNRNHMITHEGGTIPEENLTNYVADRVKTTSEVFLGLTMACAQCHDHKYDPISQKEYYQFFAFFNELDDRGLDGDGGRNPVPNMDAKSVLPDSQLTSFQRELNELTDQLNQTAEGLDVWLEQVATETSELGSDFEIRKPTLLDVTTPNYSGDFTAREDGSVFMPNPSGGLNSFSHAIELPKGKPISGIRIRFFPFAKDGSSESAGVLTPHEGGRPALTTVLVSTGDQPAKQVDLYRQLPLVRATASSWQGEHHPENVLDERNLDWWTPASNDRIEHLTLTFDEPVDPDENPYLTVMLFFGISRSLPHHWQIDGFTGVDTDSNLPEEIVALVSRPADSWSVDERAEVVQAFRERAKSLQPLRTKIENLEERVQVLTGSFSTMVMNASATPRDTFVLNRGQYDVHGEQVFAATPSVLPPLNSEERATRLDLAQWLVRPDHPLTARVAVNRIWALFFGKGLVTTSADFGSQGAWPSHPELLDWLATEFMDTQWDQKQLIRTIVSSSTYRQSSASTEEQLRLDPSNQWLGRGARFRLPAEFIRDQALAVSGLLVPRIGGPSVHPYQPPSLWKEVSHFGSTPATKQVFVQDQGEKLYRRSLYTFVKRTSPHPSMTAFDATNREMCIMERGITNTPLQALVLLNDPQFVEAARQFAAQVLIKTENASQSEIVLSAFQWITGRAPSTSEQASLIGFLDGEQARFAAHPKDALELLSVGDSDQTGDFPLDQQAATTSLCLLLLNLSEAQTRQ